MSLRSRTLTESFFEKPLISWPPYLPTLRGSEVLWPWLRAVLIRTAMSPSP